MSLIGSIITSIVALFIAVFGDNLRACFNKPKLDVSIATESPDCIKVPKNLYDDNGKVVIDSVDIYYFRLRIRNKGNRTAQNVEVYAQKLSRMTIDGSFEEVRDFIPMNLRWVVVRRKFYQNISPEGYRHCNLARIIDPLKRHILYYEDKQWPGIPPEKTILSFATIEHLNTLSHLHHFGTYRLDILVSADNAKQIKKTVEIGLSGEWYPSENDMLSKGVYIKIL